MSNAQAIEFALQAYRRPAQARSLRHQDLPAGILCLIKIAAGAEEEIELVPESEIYSRFQVKDAAVFCLQQILMHAGDDVYRQLGLTRHASLEDLKTHKRWLLKWLHPDRNLDPWENALFKRVVAAAEKIEAAMQDGSKLPPRPERNRIRKPRRPRWQVYQKHMQQPLFRRPWFKSVSSVPSAATQGVSKTGWICLVAVAIFIAYAGSASVYDFLRPASQPLHVTDVSGQSLPAAFERLSASVRQQLIAQEKSALAANRLDLRALMNLSLLYDADGQKEAAGRLAFAAAKLSLRDSKAQAAALQLDLQKGDAAGALYRIDALIRTKPQVQDELFAIVLTLAANMAGNGPVVDLLSRDPPWRQAFFLWVAEKSSEPQLAYQLISSLKSAGFSPAEEEVRSIIRHYVGAGDYATGYFVWLSLLSDMELKLAGNIFDGGFDLPMKSLYFDWTVNRRKSVEIRIASRANSSPDRVLMLNFVDNRDTVGPIHQLLRLAPGEYIFSGDFKANHLIAESGLVWRVDCVDGQKNTIVTTTAVLGSTEWDHFEVRFEVLPSCATQLLRLLTPSPAALDQKISGQAYYDNLNIAPLAATGDGRN